MKILVAGGRETADYLIELLKSAGHRVIVVQEDRAYCEYLSAKYDLAVTCGNPCQEEVLAEAGIRSCGMLVALEPRDADNLEVCQVAKRLMGVKKTACLVQNPANVEIFQRLGVDHAVSPAQILAGYAGSD